MIIMIIYLLLHCSISIGQAMLESIGVPLAKLKFVRGTDYQLSRSVKKYCYYMYIINRKYRMKW